jgi:hypothetical protein
MKPALFQSQIFPSRSAPSEEPRTGVVRKVVAAPGQVRAIAALRPRRPARDWRCLEPAQPEPRRAVKRDSSVSIAQVSLQGERLRQSGPDEWLPEAAEFVHRAALLVAQGLGFERCCSVCLQGPRMVLSVTDASRSTITGVAGPARQLSNVLRKRGLK